MMSTSSRLGSEVVKNNGHAASIAPLERRAKRRGSESNVRSVLAIPFHFMTAAISLRLCVPCTVSVTH